MNVKEYFKDKNFNNLLELLKSKYLVYGKCTGIINIKPKTLEEADKLSAFLATKIKVGVVNKIKVSKIQSRLDESRFEGITVDELVLLFYPNIKSNSEIRNIKEQNVNNIFNDYKEKYDNSNIKILFENGDSIKKIKSLIIQDNECLNIILNSLNKLPIFQNEMLELAIFSTNLTGDPHYYDLDTKASNQLLKFISILFHLELNYDRKSKIDLLEYCGIVIDSVSNFVITYNLEGNEMLDAFQKSYTPLIINLANLNEMNNIKVHNNKLLIVENPSFLSKVINKKIDYSIIVTSGNSNLIIYKLLEKLKNSKIYFNGDFDPEGLLIAQNLKNKFNNIEFIGYNEEYYKNGLSNNKIIDSRLKKLDKINDNDLKIIRDLLLETSLASYQEANYNILLNFLKRNYK